jgi:preprotein translocase subunit SecB
MTDTAAAGETNSVALTVNGQYIKDLSFEVPGAPQIYTQMQGQQPEIPIHVDVDTARVGPEQFEVTLQLKVEATLGDKKIFIVELAYGGIFTVRVPQEHLHPVLMIECPRLLFPFARNIVADMTRDGGFPPLLIQPIDFGGLYQQRLAQLTAEQEAAGHA